MRILIIDKTAGLDASHERHQAITRIPGVELHVLGPKHWIENRRPVEWNPPSDTIYTPHFGHVFGKDYYARAGYYSGLCRALLQSKPEVIQLLEEPWSISAIQTILAASIFCPKTPVFFYTWENIYRAWQYPSRAGSLYRIIDKSMHRYCKGAVCATNGAKEVLIKKEFDKPIAVIPYGIPDFFFVPPSPNHHEKPFTIGYIGRFMHMKGIDLLLDAIAHCPDIHLLLVGSGEDEMQYRSACKDKNLDSRVKWIPPVSEREIPKILQQMDVLVLPSRRIDGWMEQLGRVLIEAMASGVPVIGSSSGAIPEVIGDAGLVFEENNIDDLREKILYLSNNPQERERLSLAGRNRAENRFTWKRFAEELIIFYQRVLNSRKVL